MPVKIINIPKQHTNIRETIHVDIVLVWLLPLLKKNTLFLLILLQNKEDFFKLTLNTLVYNGCMFVMKLYVQICHAILERK